MDAGDKAPERRGEFTVDSFRFWREFRNDPFHCLVDLFSFTDLVTLFFATYLICIMFFSTLLTIPSQDLGVIVSGSITVHLRSALHLHSSTISAGL